MSALVRLVLLDHDSEKFENRFFSKVAYSDRRFQKPHCPHPVFPVDPDYFLIVFQTSGISGLPGLPGLFSASNRFCDLDVDGAQSLGLHANGSGLGDKRKADVPSADLARYPNQIDASNLRPTIQPTEHNFLKAKNSINRLNWTPVCHPHGGVKYFYANFDSPPSIVSRQHQSERPRLKIIKQKRARAGCQIMQPKALPDRAHMTARRDAERERIDALDAALRGLPMMRRVVVLETALQKLRQKLHDQEDEFRRRVEKEHTQ